MSLRELAALTAMHALINQINDRQRLNAMRAANNDKDAALVHMARTTAISAQRFADALVERLEETKAT